MKRLAVLLKSRYRTGGVKGILKLVFLRLKHYCYNIPSFYLYKLPKSKYDKKRFEKKKKKIEEQRKNDALPAFQKGDYRTYRIGRSSLRAISSVVNFPRILKNRQCRILVVVHFFYMKSVNEIIEYLKNLKLYRFDLIITYVDGQFDQAALNTISKFKPDTKFKKFPNQGYDIGPFIEAINETALNEYDIIIKMQTKGTKRDTFVYSQFFRDRDWFSNLWNGVLGSFSVHNTIDKLYGDTNYGVVAAKNLIIHDPKHKQQLTEETLSKYNIKFVDNYYFVAGSCFAIRSSCLKTIQEAKLKLSDFTKAGLNFFSLAHVTERAVCFAAMPKYKFYGNKVDFWRHLKWRRAEKALEKSSALTMIGKLGDYEIAPEYAWLALEHCFLKGAKIENVKLGDLKREHPKTGKLIKITECEPYLYLKGGKKNQKIYKDYCAYHKNDNGLPDMTIQRYEFLIKSIKENGYNKKQPIIVDSNNVICDGQHRACILTHLLGENEKIPVIKIDLITINPGKIKPFSKIIPIIESNVA